MSSAVPQLGTSPPMPTESDHDPQQGLIPALHSVIQPTQTPVSGVSNIPSSAPKHGSILATQSIASTMTMNTTTTTSSESSNVGVINSASSLGWFFGFVLIQFITYSSYT